MIGSCTAASRSLACCDYSRQKPLWARIASRLRAPGKSTISGCSIQEWRFDGSRLRLTTYSAVQQQHFHPNLHQKRWGTAIWLLLVKR